MDSDPFRLHLLIVAAGSGRRMGAERNKLLLPLEGRPLLAWTLEAALASASIEWIGLVGQERDRADIDALLDQLQPAKPLQQAAQIASADGVVSSSAVASTLGHYCGISVVELQQLSGSTPLRQLPLQQVSQALGLA